MRLLIVRDARQQPPNFGIIDRLDVSPILIDGLLFQVHILEHLLWSGSRSEIRLLTPHIRIATQLYDRICQPIQMAHLLPGNGFDIGPDASALQRIGVVQILDNGLMLTPHVGAEHLDNICLVHSTSFSPCP